MKEFHLLAHIGCYSKMGFPVLSNLKSHIITNSRVTNNNASSNLCKPLKYHCESQIPIPNKGVVAMDNHNVPPCTLSIPTVSLLWPLKFWNYFLHKMGVVPKNMPQPWNNHSLNHWLLGVSHGNQWQTLINL